MDGDVECDCPFCECNEFVGSHGCDRCAGEKGWNKQRGVRPNVGADQEGVPLDCECDGRVMCEEHFLESLGPVTTAENVDEDTEHEDGLD